MAEQGKDVPWWLKIAAVILTAVVSLIGIYAFFTAPSADLQATVDRGSFYLPPRYSEFQEKVRDVLSPEQLKKTIRTLEAEQLSSKNDKNAASLLVTRGWSDFDLSRALLDQTQALQVAFAPTYEGYWESEVVNTGNIPVSKVVLRLPGTDIAVVNREDGTSKVDTKGPVIELGELGASETVKVIAWSRSYSPSDWDEEPSIFHSDGSGSVNLKYRTLQRFLFANFGKIVAGLVVLMFITPLVTSMLTARAKKRSQNQSVT